MKTAEEWQEELNGETSLESIRAIQSDARHAALTEAAEIARREMDDCYGDEDAVASGRCEEIGKAILALRDAK